MNIFKGQNFLEFSEHFKSGLNCKEFLGEIKCQDAYKCRKCDNKTYQIRNNFSRTCNKCSDTESPTVNTIFHRVHFGVRYGITKITARLFMLKTREAMKSIESNPMSGSVHVDEFVLGGYKQGKISRSL